MDLGCLIEKDNIWKYYVIDFSKHLYLQGKVRIGLNINNNLIYWKSLAMYFCSSHSEKTPEDPYLITIHVWKIIYKQKNNKFEEITSKNSIFAFFKSLVNTYLLHFTIERKLRKKIKVQKLLQAVKTNTLIY